MINPSKVCATLSFSSRAADLVVGYSVLEYLEKKHQDDNPSLKAKDAKDAMIKKIGGEVMKCTSSPRSAEIRTHVTSHSIRKERVLASTL